jgi:hypothetical protein
MRDTPRPHYRRLPYAMQGLSWLGQILHGLRHPPRLEIIEDWSIELHGLLIVIPAGFITDGASIPRVLWWLISPFGPLLEGAILHDFGYQYGYLLARYDAATPYNLESLAWRDLWPPLFATTIPVFLRRDRQFFDETLRYVTIELNGATMQAKAAYVALRPFGVLVWAGYRQKGPHALNTNSLGLPSVRS